MLSVVLRVCTRRDNVFLQYHMSRSMRKPDFCLCENKGAVTAKLINTFVFATRIVHFIFFIVRKFQPLAIFCACAALSMSEPQKPVFLTSRLIFFSSPLATPGSVEFVFNVINIDKSSGRTYPRKGVCTGWLEQLEGCEKGQGDAKGVNGCDVIDTRKVQYSSYILRLLFALYSQLQQ